MSEAIETADELVDIAEVRPDGGVIVKYSRTEAALVTLRAKYTGASFDLTTTAGNQAARAARLELKTLRTGLEDRRKELKAPALEFGKKIDAEAKRITGEIEALENPIDAQIRADESRREAIKAEEAKREQARIAKHQEVIGEIRGIVASVAGKPSRIIAGGIEVLNETDVSEARFEEFAPAAARAVAESLEKLRDMHTAACEWEAAAERDRVERERIAAEQKAEAERLAAERAKFEKEQAEARAAQAKLDAEAAAARKAADAAAAAERAEADRIAREARAAEEARLSAERAALAAQQAEQARIAREAESKRLADEAAARAAEVARRTRLQNAAESMLGALRMVHLHSTEDAIKEIAERAIEEATGEPA